MLRTNVQSSSIKSIGYNTEELILEVEFARGAIYSYFQVPENVVKELMSAESIGSYFSKNVSKIYKFEKIGE
jgi:hypothetical protein